MNIYILRLSIVRDSKISKLAHLVLSKLSTAEIFKFLNFQNFKSPVPIFSNVQTDKLSNSPASILQNQFERNLTRDPFNQKITENSARKELPKRHEIPKTRQNPQKPITIELKILEFCNGNSRCAIEGDLLRAQLLTISNLHVTTCRLLYIRSSHHPNHHPVNILTVKNSNRSNVRPSKPSN